MFESILCQVTEYDADVLESLLELSKSLARVARGGSARHVTNPDLRGTIEDWLSWTVGSW